MTLLENSVPAARFGRCTLVGAGPGDPDLLTLKALKAIQSATVLLVDELAPPQPSQLLLTQSAKPPSAAAPRSPQVCSCMNVKADRIEQTLRQCAGSEGERLAQLQQRLGCGTQCGSCIPELKRHVQATACTLTPATA